MPASSNGQTSGNTSRFPATLTLKDLITIISVAVTLTTAWGIIGTRITLLEKEVVALQAMDSSQGVAIESLQAATRRAEFVMQEDEHLINQIHIMMNKPIPARRERYR